MARGRRTIEARANTGKTPDLSFETWVASIRDVHGSLRARASRAVTGTGMLMRDMRAK